MQPQLSTTLKKKLFENIVGKPYGLPDQKLFNFQIEKKIIQKKTKNVFENG